jgi:ankyrin repeat protein
MSLLALFKPWHLWSAAKRGDLEAIERFIAEGQEVNEKRYGETPLHRAAEAGQKEAIKLLIHHGAKINGKDDSGMTPLMYAMTGCKREDVSDLLIELGAKLDAQDHSGRTALDYAAREGNETLLALLLKRGAKPNVGKGERRSSPLVECISSRKLSILKTLLEAGAEVNIMTGLGSPLQGAAFNGRVDMVKELLNAGADPNLMDHSRYTPLRDAVVGGRPEIVEMLLKAGAQVNVVDVTGQTVLDVAIDRKRKMLIEPLRKAGAKQAHELGWRPDTEDLTREPTWQLQDDSILSASIEPWPAAAGNAKLKVRMDCEAELVGRWKIQYRLRSESKTDSSWTRIFPTGDNDDPLVEMFEAEINLKPGTWFIDFQVFSPVFDEPDGLTDWEINVTG